MRFIIICTFLLYFELCRPNNPVSNLSAYTFQANVFMSFSAIRLEVKRLFLLTIVVCCSARSFRRNNKITLIPITKYYVFRLGFGTNATQAIIRIITTIVIVRGDCGPERIRGSCDCWTYVALSFWLFFRGSEYVIPVYNRNWNVIKIESSVDYAPSSRYNRHYRASKNQIINPLYNLVLNLISVLWWLKHLRVTNDFVVCLTGRTVLRRKKNKTTYDVF